VLLAPELALWQRLLPEMDASAREKIFNRTAVIVVHDRDAPELLSINVVGVPPRAFGDVASPWFGVGALDAATWQARGGHIDTRRVTGRTLFVAGWAPWRGLAPGQSLAIYSGAPLRVVAAQRAERPDVAAVLHDDSLRFGGFVLELAREDGIDVGDDLALCLVARDALAGTATLIEPGAPACAGKTR